MTEAQASALITAFDRLNEAAAAAAIGVWFLGVVALIGSIIISLALGNKD